MQRLRGLKNILLTSIIVFGSTAASFAAQEPGNIQIIAADGKVTANTGGKTVDLKKGSMVTEGAQITTGVGAHATLLFSNGSTVVLNPESEFAIDRYTSEPFDSSKVDYKNLTTEPAVTKTKVTIRKGSLAGNMRKLRPESKFEFMTPVGPAGIRGTQVFISVKADSANPGSFIVTIAATDGTVVFTPPNGASVKITQGQYTQYRAVPTMDGAGNVTGYNMVPLTARDNELVAVAVTSAPADVQGEITAGGTQAVDSVTQIPAAPFTSGANAPGDGSIGATGGEIPGTSGFGTGGSGGGTGSTGTQVGGDQGSQNLGTLESASPTPSPTPLPPSS